ncbi:PREDICTED: uncharacterized protein LOC107357664 [Acropora digitifera]|uniref:uncharacterized protein LOC107357664 n=1 Tax=Acropora digitifera TaxID=70779 RepID=UPI00077AFC72|nr:PREDICTED: uncharacterized protein LOC107357664 [Acropora digitifera]
MSPPFFLRVKELGLQVSYREDRGTHAFIRKVMALLFLTEADIRPHFERLQQTANTTALLEFMNDVASTWMEGNTWPPSCWCVYMQSVRTNNDEVGWQYGLHTRAQGKSQLPMFLLIDLLHKEARLTSLSVRMVSENKLRRVQRRRYRQIQAKVLSLWGQYENGDKTPRQLLKACSLIVGPRGV